MDSTIAERVGRVVADVASRRPCANCGRLGIVEQLSGDSALDAGRV